MKILGRESNLSRMLEQTCHRIAALDPQRDGPAMAQQIVRARPDVKEKMDAALRNANEKVAAIIRQAMGAGVVASMKEIPTLVNGLVEKINAPSTPPALQCALVSVLAYVAQPRDLVPDDAPGGYGFVDDSALLLATMLQLTEPTPANAGVIEELKKHLASVQTILPESAVEPLALAIQGVLLLFQSMQMLPPQLATATTNQLLNEPLKATAPQPPAGWQMPNLAPAGAGHWSGGAYFEGGNVVIPGGPSLVGGELYIP